jgi:hypothetical protein
MAHLIKSNGWSQKRQEILAETVEGFKDEQSGSGIL